MIKYKEGPVAQWIERVRSKHQVGGSTPSRVTELTAKLMKIAILGGRFDPPHIGHFLIAQQTLELYPEIDKVIFVPAFKHAWSPIVASAENRIKMLKSSLQEGMEVSDIEINRKKVSYAIDTVKEFKRMGAKYIRSVKDIETVIQWFDDKTNKRRN